MLVIEIAPMSYNGTHSCLSFAGNGQFDIVCLLTRPLNAKLKLTLFRNKPSCCSCGNLREIQGEHPILIFRVASTRVLYVWDQHLFGLPLKMECTKFDHMGFDHLPS